MSPLYQLFRPLAFHGSRQQQMEVSFQRLCHLDKYWNGNWSTGRWVNCSENGETRNLFYYVHPTQLSWISWMMIRFWGSLEFWVSGFRQDFSAEPVVFMGNAIRELAPARWTGTVIGLLNLLIYGFLVVFQWGTGLMLDLFPADPASGSYSQIGYQVGFWLILILQGLSFSLVTKVRSFSLQASHHDV